MVDTTDEPNPSFLVLPVWLGVIRVLRNTTEVGVYVFGYFSVLEVYDPTFLELRGVGESNLQKLAIT